MPDDVVLHVSFAEEPKTFVAVAIHPNYVDDPVVVGMTIVQGLERLRETLDDDGA